MAKKTLYFYMFPCTHWDREGNRSLYELRLHMINQFDALLRDFERQPEMTATVLDGQAVLLEDYLSVRPQRTALIKEHVRAGQLLIGPWYTVPHQQLVSPEALIRNLLLGSQIVSDYGGSLGVGYMPDSYAAGAQMPQILEGFGIDSAVISAELATDESGQIWESPNGSSLFVVKVVQDADVWDANVESLKDYLARARHHLAPHSSGQGALCRIAVGNGLDSLRIREAIEEHNGRQRGIKILLDDLPATMRQFRQRSQHEHASLHSGIGASRAAGSLSNRVRLKLRNQQIQTLLEAWVEPFSSWAWLIDYESLPNADGGTPGTMIVETVRHVWRLLLQNHSQSTLGGCSADSVYEEALLRFSQAEQIGEELASQSLDAIAARITTTSPSSLPDDVPIVVFNASGQPRTDLVSCLVGLPVVDSRYHLIDTSGQHVSYDLIPPDGATGPTTLRFVATDVPARGYATYILRASDEGEPAFRQQDEETSIENEYVTVTCDPLRGTLDVFDKRTGRSYAGLNHFIDQGDSGNLQEFQAPDYDTVIDVPTNTPLSVQREVSGVDQSLTFLQIFRLPRQLTEDRGARQPLAAQFVPISILTRVRLIPGVPRIDVETTVTNDALDHRLSVHFGIGSDLKQLWVDGQFEILDLSAQLASSPRGRKWKSVTTAQCAFVTVAGSDTGLTIANRGLPEATVLDEDGAFDLSLSLIRATGRLRLDEGRGRIDQETYINTPKAQCRGEYTFAYSMIPHDQDMLPAWRQAWAFQTSLRAVTTGNHTGTLPDQASMVSVDNPNFVISGVKTSEDGHSIIIRGYSISRDIQMVTLRTGFGNWTAQRTRIDETPLDVGIASDDQGDLTFEVGPAEIVTLRLQPA